MRHLKQRRDELAARLYTTENRIYGHVFLVPGRSTADLLNMDQNKFISVTGAKLFTAGISHPPRKDELLGQVQFLKLNRDNVLWVLGGRSTDASTATQKELKISLLFPSCLLAGVVRVPASQRLTDLLYTANAFVSLYKVQVFPYDGKTPFSKLTQETTYEFATVNIQKTISVVEIG